MLCRTNCMDMISHYRNQSRNKSIVLRLVFTWMQRRILFWPWWSNAGKKTNIISVQVCFFLHHVLKPSILWLKCKKGHLRNGWFMKWGYWHWKMTHVIHTKLVKNIFVILCQSSLPFFSIYYAKPKLIWCFLMNKRSF